MGHITDEQVNDRAQALIAELEREKAALHSEQEK
jgi:hypothetical protein